MSDKFNVILDPHFRKMEELFSESDLGRLRACSNIIWAKSEPMPREEYEAALPRASVVISANWGDRRIDSAPDLRAIIEVGGHFPKHDVVDYKHCRRNGIYVLSCAPAFGPSVSEMALTLTLASLRNVVRADREIRARSEVWMGPGNRDSRSLAGLRVGFVGFGTIARQTLDLLAPFRVRAAAYDPWLAPALLERSGVTPLELGQLMEQSDILYVTAMPTAENKGLVSREMLELLPQDAHLILISRAHLVDFEALTELVLSGRLRAAIDVFPQEPLPADHPIRDAEGAILSPHHAGSIPSALRRIGSFVADDVEMLSRGLAPVSLQQARLELTARM